MVLRQCGFMVSMFFVGLIYPVFEPSPGNFPRYVGYQSSYENAIKYLTKKMAIEKKK